MNHGMMIDQSTGDVLLFGGSSGGAETWRFVPATSTWTQLSPGTRPPSRAQFGFAYDSTNGRAVIMGGSGGTTLGDVWAFHAAPLRTTLGNVLTFTDTGLTNGLTYYYRVAARNSQGVGVS